MMPSVEQQEPVESASRPELTGQDDNEKGPGVDIGASCCICLEDMKAGSADVWVLPCHHAFHGDCLNRVRAPPPVPPPVLALSVLRSFPETIGHLMLCPG